MSRSEEDRTRIVDALTVDLYKAIVEGVQEGGGDQSDAYAIIVAILARLALDLEDLPEARECGDALFWIAEAASTATEIVVRIKQGLAP